MFVLALKAGLFEMLPVHVPISLVWLVLEGRVHGDPEIEVPSSRIAPPLIPRPALLVLSPTVFLP